MWVASLARYVQAAGNAPFMTAKLRPSPVKFTRAPATPIAPPSGPFPHGASLLLMVKWLAFWLLKM